MERLAAIYARLSGDRGDEAPVARQVADTQTWCEGEGLTVSHTFCDMLSGYRADVARPEFDAAVEWATAGSGRTLIVWKLDRLSRRGMGQVGLVLDQLEAAQSRVVFLRDGLDSSVPGHRMVIAILSEQARQESANTSLRTRAGMSERRRAGKWLGGRPPFGYRIICHAVPAGANPAHFLVDPDGEPGKLAHDPETAPVLAEMARRAIEGETLYGLTCWLTAEGVPTSHGATSWRADTVKAILLSPVLVGYLPESKQSPHPLRDPETGEPVQVTSPLICHADRRLLLAALEARSRKRKGPGRLPKALLTGLLECAECGTGMVRSGNRYVCPLMSVGGGCPGTTVGVRNAEPYITGLVLDDLAKRDSSDPALVAVSTALVARPKDRQLEAERETLRQELDEARAVLDELEDAYYSPRRRKTEFPGKEGASRYERLHARALVEVERLSAAFGEVEPVEQVRLTGEALRAAFEAASADACRAALEVVLDRVLVFKAATRGVFLAEQRLKLAWRDASQVFAAVLKEPRHGASKKGG